MKPGGLKWVFPGGARVRRWCACPVHDCSSGLQPNVLCRPLPSPPALTPSLGMDLLGSFERELVRHEKNRQELANAEKLFDLPITMYPELLKVQKEMTGLRMIYELYEELKVSTPDAPPRGAQDSLGPRTEATTLVGLGRCHRCSRSALGQTHEETADGVSLWGDEKVLELDSGDGCTTCECS